jgi:hypothetical protein
MGEGWRDKTGEEEEGGGKEEEEGRGREERERRESGDRERKGREGRGTEGRGKREGREKSCSYQRSDRVPCACGDVARCATGTGGTG